jgi:nitrate reductase gamma subunit
MSELEFLTWVRGPGLAIALTIFVVGVLWRLLEVFTLGRRKDIAPARPAKGASGLHTVLRRSLPPDGMLKRAPVNYIAGYVFHVGLGLVVFFFIPHILLIDDLIGVSWPGLRSGIIDLVTVLTMAAMLVLLGDRILNPVKRFLSGFSDWFGWGVTFLPLLTGWLAVQHLLLPYTTMLAVHIVSAEFLLAVLPFSKLFHTFTLFGSRWYNGRAHAHRGVPV